MNRNLILESKQDVFELIRHIDAEFKRIRKELNFNKEFTDSYYKFHEKIIAPWLDDEFFKKDSEIDSDYESYMIDKLLDFLNRLKKI